jgi:hypothetical protein
MSIANGPIGTDVANDTQTPTSRSSMTREELSRMPWTRDLMTPDEFERWVASRPEAGRAIDVETSELDRWAAFDADPYGFRYSRGELSPEMQQIGTNRFVRTPESCGWVSEDDLPVASGRAMYDRIHREAEAYKAMKESLKRAASAVDNANWKASWVVSGIVTEAVRAFAAGRGVLDVSTIARLIHMALEAGVERDQIRT